MTRDSLEALSFFSARQDATLASWNVTPTGDWSTDCATGRNFGAETVTFMRARESGMIGLSYIVQANKGAGHIPTGVEVGFMSSIAGAVTC